MDLLELKKAEEIRQQIEELEKIINYKLSPLDTFFIIKQEPKFRLAIKTKFLFDQEMMVQKELYLALRYMRHKFYRKIQHCFREISE